MSRRCVAAGCSNTNADGVSLFHFPRGHPSLRQKWNKQVQRTRADWKDATQYSVLCSEHFTSDSFIATQFGSTKRKRLKPDAVPTIFGPLNIAARTRSHDHLQEGPSVSSRVGHKRGASTEESFPSAKRERARVCQLNT